MRETAIIRPRNGILLRKFFMDALHRPGRRKRAARSGLVFRTRDRLASQEAKQVAGENALTRGRKGARESSNRASLGNRQRRTDDPLGRKQCLPRKIREIVPAWRCDRRRVAGNEARSLFLHLEILRTLLLLLPLVRDLAAHRAWVISAEGSLDTSHERMGVSCVIHHHPRPGNALENRPMATDHEKNRHPGKGNPQ